MPETSDHYFTSAVTGAFVRVFRDSAGQPYFDDRNEITLSRELGAEILDLAQQQERLAEALEALLVRVKAQCEAGIFEDLEEVRSARALLSALGREEMREPDSESPDLSQVREDRAAHAERLRETLRAAGRI
jgi:hypothetical protein